MSTVSVSAWIVQLKASGHGAAAQNIWERYYQRLIALARKKLRNTPVRVADEEDAALSAFDSFFRRAKAGQFPRLSDRGDLWQILVMVTERKAIDLLAQEKRQKRGGGTVINDPVLEGGKSGQGRTALENTPGREPTPEFAAMAAEECRRLLDMLNDDVLRQMAVLKLEGDSTKEIAAKLECVPRTVERKLRLIRDIWAKAGEIE